MPDSCTFHSLLWSLRYKNNTVEYLGVGTGEREREGGVKARVRPVSGIPTKISQSWFIIV